MEVLQLRHETSHEEYGWIQKECHSEAVEYF